MLARTSDNTRNQESGLPMNVEGSIKVKVQPVYSGASKLPNSPMS
jgi:hypothetical protein